MVAALAVVIAGCAAGPEQDDPSQETTGTTTEALTNGASTSGGETAPVVGDPGVAKCKTVDCKYAACLATCKGGQNFCNDYCACIATVTVRSVTVCSRLRADKMGWRCKAQQWN